MRATRVCSTSWDLAQQLSATDTEKAVLRLSSATTAVVSTQLWETAEEYTSWAGFHTHFPSLWQMGLNFDFKPTPSSALKGDSTPGSIKEQEWPEHGWHGAWAQRL